MIQETEQFNHMLRFRVPWNRAMLACRLILVDLSRGINVTPAETMQYVRKARDIIRQGPTERKPLVVKNWGAFLGVNTFRVWNFGYNKSSLRSGHKWYLNKVVIGHLKRITGNKVTIILSGRASQSGKNRELGLVNYELALRRAQSVKKYLSDMLPKPKYSFNYEIEYRKANIPFEMNVHENYKDRSVVITAAYKDITTQLLQQKEVEGKRRMNAKEEEIWQRLYPIFNSERNFCNQLRLMKCAPKSIGIGKLGKLTKGRFAKTWGEYFSKHAEHFSPKLIKKIKNQLDGLDWTGSNAIKICTSLLSQASILRSGKIIDRDTFRKFFSLYWKNLKK